MKYIKILTIILITLLAAIDVSATELKSSGRILDLENTTTSNLAIDEIFTGTWRKSTDFLTVLVQVDTDQDSAVHGLEIQTRYSAEPTAIHTHAYTVYAATLGVHFEEALSGDEYRIVYTNGGTATTLLSITATPSRSSVGIHMHPADHVFKENHPVQLGRSIIAGITKAGTSGNVRVSDSFSLFVHQEAHARPKISVHMTRTTGITDTLTVASEKGVQTITVSNGSQWVEGNKIKILDGLDSEHDILKIVTIGTPGANDLILDRTLDIGHGIGTSIIGVSPNMSVDGSTTPISFTYAPISSVAIHIHSIHVTIESTIEPSLGYFGGQTAFDNGVHFKISRATGRDDTYWIPFRSMNSMVLSGFSFTPLPKIGGTYFSNLSLNMTEDSNTVILIDGTVGEYLEVIIQDNNNDGNIAMEVKLSIHEVD